MPTNQTESSPITLPLASTTVVGRILPGEAALAAIGPEALRLINEEDADFTDRLMDNGRVEFAARIWVDGRTIAAYYYQAADEVNEVEDLSNLTWEVDHYTIY
jgi:hypothetical protein